MNKPGYKQTPLGWIPEDWEVKKIQELIDDMSIIGHLDGNHGELYPSVDEFVESGVPYISANNFISGKVDFESCKFLPEDRARQFKKGVAIDGDVLFAHNATVGPVAILRTQLKYVILSTTATYFRCNDEKLLRYFLLYALQSPFFVQQYEPIMGQSTRNQVPVTTQRKLSLTIPPLPEQRRIAAILSTWDVAINKEQQLIEALHDRHRSLMQQLLSGKKRLPKFKDIWKEARLGELFQEIKDTNDGRGHPAMTISARHGLISQQDKFDRVIAGDSLEKYTLLKKGDFAYNKGNSKLYQMGCIYLLASSESAIVPFVYICFRPTSLVDSMFYKYWFAAHGLDKQLKQIITSGARGDGLLNVNAEDFFKLKVPFLQREEQTAIAAILSASDKEIQTHRRRLDAMQQQKKGLMQVLLTGKVRVKTKEM